MRRNPGSEAAPDARTTHGLRDRGDAVDLPPGRLTADELALARRIEMSLAPLMESPTATTVSLPDSRLLLMNDAFLRLTGYDRDELLGVSALNLLPAKLRPEVRAQREAMLSRPDNLEDAIADAYSRTVPLLRKGGREIVVRGSSILVRSRTGAPVVFINRGIPLTPTDQPPSLSDARLGSADASLLGEALAEIPNFDGLAEPSAVTSPAGILLRVNGAFTNAFGWANHEIAGLQAVDLVIPELRGWAEERLAEITGAPLLPRPSTSRLRHRDGRAIDVNASSIPVRDEAGTTRYIVATAIPRPTDPGPA